MRPAAQIKAGFYAAHEKAVALAASFLEPPKNRNQVAILDPCAGEGHAISQFASLLNVPPRGAYAIEIDHDRATAVNASLPGAHVLAPASFFDCAIT